MYFNQARYYSLSAGRFLGRDSDAGSPSCPLSENLYSYAWDNPTQSLENTRSLISQFQVIELNQPIADKYAEIKAVLKQSGQVIADFDLLIAATALIKQRTLVTNNLKHFNRLSAIGLALENWKN